MKRSSLLVRLAALAVAVAILCLSACTLSGEEPKTAEPVRAAVVSIEKYGHVVLDITAADLAAHGYSLGDVVRVSIASFEGDMPYYDGYYCDPGELMLRGSEPNEQVAICINFGNFAADNGVAIGDTAEITLSKQGGMLATQDLCSLKYTNNRADYADDAVFANFRAMTQGRLGPNKLYRSASPISDEYGRAAYTYQLFVAANVATVLNLSDSIEDVEELLEQVGSDAARYQELYHAKRVAALDLGNNLYTTEFAQSMAEGFTFLAQNEPPYLIHCVEGKDRTGFAAMLLGALMGAELDEVIYDYMLSFDNYYGITEQAEPKRYQTVLDINLIPMLFYVTGVDTYEELTQIDLEAAVIKYLTEAGMSATDIATLQQKLGA